MISFFWPRVSTRGHCLHFVSQKKHRLFHFIMSSCDTWQVTVFNCHNIVDLVICFVTKSLSNNFCHKTHDKFISSHNSLLIHHHSKKCMLHICSYHVDLTRGLESERIFSLVSIAFTISGFVLQSNLLDGNSNCARSISIVTFEIVKINVHERKHLKNHPKFPFPF